jgi:hypothetical protein
MCPLCLSAAVLYATGATATTAGGLATLAWRRKTRPARDAAPKGVRAPDRDRARGPEHRGAGRNDSH